MTDRPRRHGRGPLPQGPGPRGRGLTRREALLSLLTAIPVIAAGEGGRAAQDGTGRRPAPDFTGIEAWFNSAPLTMTALRGQVVLVDFWSYSCINCVRTLPFIARWQEAYRDRGLVVVGVHTPELPAERNRANLERAIRRLRIAFPVAQDNASATWAAYGNEYWPTQYLVDRSGRIAFRHIGEGDYDEKEQAIRDLIATPPPPAG